MPSYPLENPLMRDVVIETSCGQGEIGLGDGEKVFARRSLSADRRHARDLIPILGELFRSAGWKGTDIDRVIVNVGPGSYTGLRVGLMVGKTLCFSASGQLITVPCPNVFAEASPTTASTIDVLIDGQQGNIYLSRFRRTDTGSLTQEGSTEVHSFTDWLQSAPADVYVTGPGLERFAKQIPTSFVVADLTSWQPNLDVLYRIGNRMAAAGEFADFWTAEPLYLRPSAAEQNHERRLGGSITSVKQTP